ncbi:MAG: helix-turn-helix domain-containing protein [Gemmatimonadales bacterium]
MKRGTTNAVEILRHRIIGDDARKRALLEKERLNVRVAQMIYDYRTAADLSQKDLADMVGTTQSVISRLENTEYRGHSLTMLERIAHAFDRRITVDMRAAYSDAETVHFAFQQLLRDLRRKKRLTVDELAAKLDLPASEVTSLERDPSHRPHSSVLQRLSTFYQIPENHLAELAGITATVPKMVRERATEFAAGSDSATKISRDEGRALDRFVQFLRSGSDDQ